MLAEEGEILDDPKAGKLQGFSVSKVRYEEVKELRVFLYPIHVEMNFQKSRLCAFQAHLCQVPLGAGDRYPIPRGRDDGLAPISAHVSQWDDSHPVFIGIVGNASSDIRQDLRWQPVDRPRCVPYREDEPQNIMCSGFEAVNLCSPWELDLIGARIGRRVLTSDSREAVGTA